MVKIEETFNQMEDVENEEYPNANLTKQAGTYGPKITFYHPTINYFFYTSAIMVCIGNPICQQKQKTTFKIFNYMIVGVNNGNKAANTITLHTFNAALKIGEE